VAAARESIRLPRRRTPGPLQPGIAGWPPRSLAIGPPQPALRANEGGRRRLPVLPNTTPVADTMSRRLCRTAGGLTSAGDVPKPPIRGYQASPGAARASEPPIRRYQRRGPCHNPNREAFADEPPATDADNPESPARSHESRTHAGMLHSRTTDAEDHPPNTQWVILRLRCGGGGEDHPGWPRPP
jgi:hypothetical protein